MNGSFGNTRPAEAAVFRARQTWRRRQRATARLRQHGEELDTAAIITTTANRTLSAVHERMPVFVAPEAFDLWLDCANVEADVAAACAGRRRVA